MKMCYTPKWSFSRILEALDVLMECGFEVKEVEANPWAFSLLVENLRLMSGSGEPPTLFLGDTTSVKINHHGQVVRITMKPPLELEFPPKVPVPAESSADG